MCKRATNPGHLPLKATTLPAPPTAALPAQLSPRARGSLDPGGRRQPASQHLQLRQAPVDGVCDGDGALGAHQAVPEVDHLHLPQGLQRLREARTRVRALLELVPRPILVITPCPFCIQSGGLISSSCCPQVASWPPAKPPWWLPCYSWEHVSRRQQGHKVLPPPSSSSSPPTRLEPWPVHTRTNGAGLLPSLGLPMCCQPLCLKHPSRPPRPDKVHLSWRTWPKCDLFQEACPASDWNFLCAPQPLHMSLLTPHGRPTRLLWGHGAL